MTVRLRLPQLTQEDLLVRWRMDDDALDPTVYDADYAWTAVAAEPTVWAAADWAAGGPPYRVLVPTDQPEGTYRLWVRLTTPGEVPVRLVAVVEFHT